jgi:hypothetical protein
MKSFDTKIKRLATPFSMIALVLTAMCPAPVMGQESHAHAAQPQPKLTIQQEIDADTLVKIVRKATERYNDLKVAQAEGYALQFGCVSGSDDGAMGLHYVNGALVGKGELDVNHPQIVIYEPLPNGDVKLIGADFLVLAEDWNKKHPEGPPQLMGQLFHLFESPNRFGLPAFYTLHVWAWKDNPKGAYVNWHPDVSCKNYAPQK